MYKASVVGLDNSGKTAAVRALKGRDGISTIHLTSYRHAASKAARIGGDVEVLRIDTEKKPIEDVTEEIIYTLKKRTLVC